jgi:hypothetical protein
VRTPRTSRLSPNLRSRVNEEHGQALVLAMVILVVGLLLALAAVAYALNVGQQGAHDQQRRAALQASDTGVQQQLYQQANANAVGFNSAAGSLGGLLECVESNLGLNAGLGVSTTLVQVSLNLGGACPQPTCTAGTPNCSSGGGPTWSSLDNGDYYDAEFCPNPQYQKTGGTPTAPCATPATGSNASSLAVLFPEIVSVGCHSAAATCDTGASTNQYAKQLALLSPTAPLQAIEGENNVRINPTNGTTCSGISLIGICLGQSSVTATVLDGNVVAGNALQLPSATVGLSLATAGNLVTNVLNYLSGILGLTGLTNPLLQSLGLSTGLTPVTLTPTLEYGNCYGGTVTPASGVTSPSTSSCSNPSLTLNGNLVKTNLSNACTAGAPSTSCTLSRPSFSAGSTATVTPLATITPMFTAAFLGPALSACPTATSAQLANGLAGSNCYSNGDLSLTSGSLSLAPGTYAFCNVYVGTGASLNGPTGSKGAVQIYILSPTSPQCSGNSTGANNTEGTTCSGSDSEGNFSVPGGINNSLGGLVNGLTNVVDPSNFQIYAVGDPGDVLTVNSNCQPRTAVTIGGSNVNLTQAFVLYAPRSNTSVATTLAYEGSVVGWNVNLTALVILQDLNLGNYPLSSVVNSYQTAQTVSCSSTNTQLTGTAADLNGC